MTKTFFVTLALTLSPFLAQANDDIGFYEALSQFEDCATAEECKPYTEQILLDYGANNISPESREKLLKIADNHAYIWMDTILEGDYIAVGETVLDEASAVYKNGSLIGYIIQYSQKAYATGACDYDYENEETLQDCDAGRISEKSYVSPDFKQSETSENGYANFDN